jgi:hypothetical protein
VEARRREHRALTTPIAPVGETGGKDSISPTPAWILSQALAIAMVRGAPRVPGQKCPAALARVHPEIDPVAKVCACSSTSRPSDVGDVADFRNFMAL